MYILYTIHKEISVFYLYIIFTYLDRENNSCCCIDNHFPCNIAWYLNGDHKASWKGLRLHKDVVTEYGMSRDANSIGIQ